MICCHGLQASADHFAKRIDRAVMAFQNSGGVREALLHAASGDESEDGQVRRSQLSSLLLLLLLSSG